MLQTKGNHENKYGDGNVRDSSRILKPGSLGLAPSVFTKTNENENEKEKEEEN